MKNTPRFTTRTALISCALLTCSAPTAHALIKFNDGREEIFVTGVASFGYDSNFAANALSGSDTFFSGGLDLDYLRKVGLIGVNANLGWNYTEYTENSEFNYVNPHSRLEFTKERGRTTGSLTLAARRESRSESVLNIRTDSWNYEGGLNLKYPVIDRYFLTGKFNYELNDYRDNTELVDLRSYTAATDLFYVYNSARDLFAGYRYRQIETTNDSTDHDHAFTIGTTGKILAKLNGTVRFGYQLRQTDDRFGNDRDHDGFSALASTTWTVSRRLTLTGRVTHDFATLASDTGVETTSAGLDTQMALNSRVAIFGGIGGGHTRFLDLDPERRDTSFITSLGISYARSDRLKIILAHGYLQNWSTLDFSDYDRHSINLTLSSRW